MKRNVLFAAALLLLGAIGVAFPATIGYGAAGAIAATVAWIYYSLRDADLERSFGSVDLTEGDNTGGGPIVPRPSGPANPCADLAHDGHSCDADVAGGDHG